MLKIKQGIKLRDLEKFGFEYNDEDKDSYYKQLKDGHIFINFHRNICIYSCKSCFEIETLYDLIKADLVEKVGDDK